MERKDFDKKLELYANRVNAFEWENLHCYSHWLAQTFYFVSHSTRLIALAASRFYRNQDRLHERFLKHISEEKFHERLALQDLKHLHLDIKDIPELSVTQGFYQSQYYHIERVSPESFLGYILALEGIAVLAGENVTRRVENTYGKKPTSFLKVHSSEDIIHIESAFEQVFDQTEGQIQLIYKNFVQSGELYCRMLDQIEEAKAQLKSDQAA